MDWFTIVLAIIIISILFNSKSNKNKRLQQMMSQLPGPRRLPIVGNIHELFTKRENMLKVAAKWDKNHGHLYSTQMGPFLPHVHIVKAEYAEVLLNNSKHTKKSLAYEFLHPWLGSGLLTSYGDKWFKHRKLLTPSFHFQVLDNFLEAFNTNSQILVNRLMKKANTDVEFDIYPYITLGALDIICESSMGTKINAQRDEKSTYVTSLYSMITFTVQRFTGLFCHPDVVFYNTLSGKRYQQALKVVHDFTNNVIHKRKELRANYSEEDGMFDETGRKKKKAFLDMLLDAASTQSVPMTDEELREEVDTFMFEGHDTTTAALCWSIMLLGNNLNIQEKVYEEQRTIFGDDRMRQVTMKDLSEMKYLERVVKEALRLYPSVPFIGRFIEEDLQIGQYTVPKNVSCIVHILGMHRDPQAFPDPLNFDPDRFLPENSVNRHPYAYIPFSAGARNCIGQKFAMLEEKTVLSHLLRNYQFESMERPEDIPMVFELILRPADGIKVKITQRV